MRQTDQWLKEHLARTGATYVENGKRHGAGKPPGIKTGKAERKRGELITTLKPLAEVREEFAPAIGKGKNKTEKLFQDTFLLPAYLDGLIVDCKFEQVTLKLGDRTRYTPDFFVRWASGALQFFEIKGGYIYEDARVKFHCACTQFPEYAFQLCQYTPDKEWRTVAAVRCNPITTGGTDVSS